MGLYGATLELKMTRADVYIPTNRDHTTPVLRIRIHEIGHAYQEPVKLRPLAESTTIFAKYRTWNVKQLQSVLRKWAWAMLFKRLPIFNLRSRDKFDKAETSSVKPSYIASLEEQPVANLFHLIYPDLTRSFGKSVYCTDPSLKGGAVPYTPRCFKKHEQLLAEVFKK